MSVETELFNLLNNRKYAEALTLLKQNPNLDVNALNDEGDSFFMVAVTKYTKESPQRYAFIEMLLSNPEFKQANKPYEDNPVTASMHALRDDDPVLAELILKYKDKHNMEVLFFGKRLMYAAQAKVISDLEKSSSIHNSLPDRRKILAILLQMTVHEAIKRDDPTLLQHLVDAGAKLQYRLKDNTYPMDLVADHPELKVHKWLSNYIQEQISSNPTLVLAAHSLARQHKECEQEIITQQIKNTRENIQRMFRFFDYEKTQPSTSEQAKPGANSGIKNPGQ